MIRTVVALILFTLIIFTFAYAFFSEPLRPEKLPSLFIVVAFDIPLLDTP